MPPLSSEPGLRQRKKDQLRDQLRRAATRLFLERGFDETTIDDIVEVAQVSRRTFFRYFATKEDAWFTTPEADRESINRIVRERPAGDSPLLVARLAYTDLLLQNHADVRGSLAMARLTASSPAVRAKLASVRERTVTMIAGALAKRLGRSSEDLTPRVIAANAVWTAAAAIDRWVFEDGGRPLDEIIDEAFARANASFQAFDSGAAPASGAKTGRSGHALQFYAADPAVLIANACRFLSTGLTAGEHVFVITTRPEKSALFTSLDEAGTNTPNAIAEGRLQFVEAEAMLAGLMVDGSPHEDRFESLIGKRVRRSCERSAAGVRAYGNGVGLLWQRGERLAAIGLEHLWHRLAVSTGIDLFCGYPVDVFGKDLDVGPVDDLLIAHTHLLSTAPSDELERAVGRAMRDVLYPNVVELRDDVFARPARWPVIPRGEAIVFWLKRNLPETAPEILERARTYYRAARAVAAPPASSPRAEPRRRHRGAQE